MYLDNKSLSLKSRCQSNLGTESVLINEAFNAMEQTLYRL